MSDRSERHSHVRLLRKLPALRRQGARHRARPGTTTPTRLSAIGAVIAMVASLTVASLAGLGAAPASAAPGDPTGCGYGTGGPEASTLCWVDMSGYNETEARSAAGQPMSVSLPGGYTISFTLKETAPPAPLAWATNTTVNAFPTYSGAYLGNIVYQNTPGQPAFYSHGDSGSGYGTTGDLVTLSGITVRDSAGAPVTGYGFVMADAESTGGDGEQITFSADTPFSQIPDPGSPPYCTGGLTGVGTDTVTCKGSVSDGPAGVAGTYGAAILQTNTPSTVSALLRDGGYQAVAFAIVTSKIQVTKQVVGRVNPTDSFDVSAVSPEGTTLGSASTGAGNSATTGSLTVLPLTSGTPYTLSESAGTGTNMAGYSRSWSCTNADPLSSTVLPSGTDASVQVTPQPGDDISCTVTNTAIPTITVKKVVAGRVQAGDQFTVGLDNSAGTTLTSATTSGTDSTASTTAQPVSQDTAYTITDAMAAGSPDALSAYDATIACVNTTTDEPVATTGAGPSWGVTSTSGEPITCTVTNTPGTPSYTVTKTASTSVVHPGGTIDYTVTVRNTGTVPYTADHQASFTDNLTGVLDDATYNSDAAATAGDVNYSAPTLSWSGALGVGATATITYSVKVATPDTGDGVLPNTVVTPPDSGGNCPAGSTDQACTTQAKVQAYRVEKTTTATSVTPGGTVDYTVTVTNTGQVAYTAADPATVTDDLSAVLDDATYNSDAAATAGDVSYSAPTLSWSGALAVGATATITYSVKVDDPDTGNGRLDNSVVTGPGGNCATNSTDPACTADVPSKSYTVHKSASEAVADAGDTVTYTVVVTNTGQTDYTATDPATFTDDLTGVLDDATYGGDAAATSGQVSYAAPTLSWSGALPVGGTATITYSVKVANPDSGDHHLRNAVTNPPGIGGGCAAGSTDPGCTTDTPVRSYTLKKTASAATTVPGGTVTYTVTVTNTGQAAYTGSGLRIVDDMSGALDDATFGGDATATTGSVHFARPLIIWTVPLAVGATETLTYSMTVDDPDTGDGMLDNVLVTYGGGACPTGTTNPDCATHTPVRSYTVAKAASTAIAHPGEKVTYTVTVTNTGKVAYTADDPASFTDDLSAVLDDASYHKDAKASGGAVSYTAPTLSWSGALGVGETVTVTYSVTVNAPDTGDGILKNAADPSGPGGACGDGSTPPPCAAVQVPVQSYEVAKSASTDVVRPGGVVTYTVTVTNTGQIAYTAADPASFTDDLSAVLDDAMYHKDAKASGGTVTYSEPTLSWSGALDVGETVIVTYSVTVNSPDAGDGMLTNAALPPVSPPGEPPTGGTCAGGTPPPCTPTQVPVQSFRTVKTADRTSAVPGQKITYTVVVTNTGEVAYTAADPASFTDDLTAVLDDASYNKDAKASGGAVSYDKPTLSWSGPLGVGETVTITYSVTVNSPDTGDQSLINGVVTPPGSGGNCAPGSTDPDCRTRVTNSALTVHKTASARIAAPGATITYTVTVTNSGKTAFTTADPASFTDDLTGVLDDASYSKDAKASAGEVSYAAPMLSWSGPLAVGASVTVTYSVTVNSPDAGDKSLDNAVTTPPTVNGNCATGTADADCTTSTPVAEYTVRKVASTSTVKPGGIVTYTVTVTNTGKVDFTAGHPASVTDDMTGVLDDATYNGDAAAGSGTLHYAAPVLSWSGELPVGASVTVSYSITVHDPDRGDGALRNVVTTPNDPAGDTVGNCPSGTSNPGCITVGAVAQVAPPAPKPPLAYTGNDTAFQVGLAAMLLIAGSLLAIGWRRRRAG